MKIRGASWPCLEPLGSPRPALRCDAATLLNSSISCSISEEIGGRPLESHIYSITEKYSTEKGE